MLPEKKNVSLVPYTEGVVLGTARMSHISRTSIITILSPDAVDHVN